MSFSPIHANGGYWAFQGNTPTTTSAVFTLNASKSRAVGSNHMLSGSFSAGSLAAGVMVENTSAGKSSRCIVHSSAGGSNWNLTQPFAKLSVPTTTLGPTEIDTWANTDTINVLGLVKVNIVSFLPTIADQSSDNYGYLYQLNVYDPQGIGDDSCTLNGCVMAMECVFQRGVSYVQDQNTLAGSTLNSDGGLQNCYFLGGLFISATVDTVFVIGGGTNNFTSSYGEANFDGDYIAGGFGFNFLAGGNFGLGLVFLDANSLISGGSVVRFASQLYGSHVLYGTTGKTINFQDKSVGIMVTGTFANGWTQATLISTGVQLNGSAFGMATAGNGIVYGSFATTITNLDTYAGLQNITGGSVMA